MDDSPMTVTVTSDPEREDLYAEIFFQDSQWAEVRFAPGTASPELLIYPPLDGKPYVFPLEAARRALEEAITRLQKVESK